MRFKTFERIFFTEGILKLRSALVGAKTTMQINLLTRYFPWIYWCKSVNSIMLSAAALYRSFHEIVSILTNYTYCVYLAIITNTFILLLGPPRSRYLPPRTFFSVLPNVVLPMFTLL